MRKINIARPSFEYDDDDPEGFRSGMMRVGPGLGAVQTGTSVYEIPPGQLLCPYHYEWGEEEWLLVLEGTPTLRDPDGTATLEPWDLVLFVPGPEGAHSVGNDSDRPVRVLMYSTVVHPSATEYPDSGKVGVWPGDQSRSLIVERSSAVDYFHGEAREAGGGAEVGHPGG